MTITLSKSVSTKLSGSQYAILSAGAHDRGLSVSEHSRQIIITALSGKQLNEQTQILQGEFKALRSIILNIIFAIITGEQLTKEQMQYLINRADQENYSRGEYPDSAEGAKYD